MKTIAVEEHFESKVVTAKMQQLPNQQSIPKMVPEMQRYMQEDLPSPEMMQDITEARLDFMNHYNIDVSVLSYGNVQPQNLEPVEAIPLSRLANDELAKITQQSNRFEGLAVLPVGDPTAAATELKRAVTALGLKGVMLKGNFQGKFFDDPEFLPIFQMASDLNVPVYFHPSFVPNVITDHYYNSENWSGLISGILGSDGFGWHNDVGIQVMRMVVSGIFDKFPNLNLISGHWGEGIPFYFQRLDDELTKWADLKKPFSQYYQDNIYISPSGMLTMPQFNLLREQMGMSKLLYAIDYPYKQPENSGSFIQNLPISDFEKEQFAHGNAEKLFHL
ncbi:amidohydrolase family protein [Lacticaseibacillus brantae]|uniref:Amidohydrolase-related domain-containing protein n=1 Tax=Lacticaseibacillus brantae DSM 23927 TaxID=1423727 RepID=A0A0R2B0W0_9LACO|nr:amidohydrolase family protein [Lacticaseibacillus brantae]KRM72976.1 hypothetical protein FC34_GL000690 [Lacticaseibacillus brantae DSM 23927]